MIPRNARPPGIRPWGFCCVGVGCGMGKRWRRGRTSPPLRGPPRPFRGGVALVIPCNAHGSPERVELSGGQFDSVKSSLDSCQRQLTEGFFPKGTTSCVKGIPISRLDKSRVSAIMKTKGDTVTCSQAPDLIANMLYQLTIRLPSSGQHAFVARRSSKIAASRRTCNNLFHIRTTSLRMKCAGILVA